MANRVRREWAAAASPQERSALLGRLNEALREVDHLLGQCDMRPGQLPAPSRRAYRFLRELSASDACTQPTLFDSVGRDQTPGGAASVRPAGGPSPESVSFRGLRAFHQQLLDNIAVGVDDGRLEPAAMLEVVRSTRQRLDRAIQRDGLTADHLKPVSRELVAWFRWAGEPAAFDAYVQAVRRAQRALADGVAARLKWRAPLLVRFEPSSRIYAWRIVAGGTQISMNTPLLNLDERGFEKMGRWMTGDKAAGRWIDEFMMSAAYRETAEALQATVGFEGRTYGIMHDLAASFDRVNRGYFGGTMPRPKLRWTRSLTGRVYGHYQFSGDIVSISGSLDRPDVPAFVVDHVMHHELLHKKHGLDWRGHRRHAHTPAFREEERQFARYDEAAAFLERLVRADARR